MLQEDRLLIGRGSEDAFILPKMANRHGLICGATGTGKTITLKVMAESFSDLGVPVFLADVKGDLSGCVKRGVRSDALDGRLEHLGLDPDAFEYKSFPVRFWDVFGQSGHPVRTTVSEMGASLLARLLDLTDVQAGVLNIVFRVADDLSIEPLLAEDYEVMDELALKAEPGSGGLLFLPYLSGERTPWNDPDARGIYFGLSLKHAQPELVRSTMEGIIFNQKSSLEIFSEMGISCDQVIASGGGARGPVFRQLEADMFDCEVRTNSINEQGCIGAAIIAAVGCGSFDDYAQACSHIVHLSDEVVEPDPKRHLFYEERYSVFKELYPVTRDLMHRNTK